MNIIDQTLLAFPFFKPLAPGNVCATTPLWSIQWIKPGDALWKQGDAVHDLALVTAGELMVLVDEVDIGRVKAGEMVGEVTVFLDGAVRSATLRSLVGTEVLTLSVTALRHLRQKRSEVYDALLDQALITLARRVRNTDRQIARLVQGSQSAPARTEPSVLVRLWKALRPGPPAPACPDLEPLLRQESGHRSLTADVFTSLSVAFTAQPVQEGQIIFLEGEPGAASYLVADGQIDVLRHVRGDRAELLASLQPGDQFGLNTLVEPGTRSASCVAVTPGWLYRMDSVAFKQLKGEARLLWRETMLSSLASQVRNANNALQRAIGGGSPLLAANAPPRAGNEIVDSFNDLLRASGFLEGLPSHKELENVQVVMDEEQRRNPRGGRR